jgi:copper oxidase (laccase) domain-containing protein
MPTDRLVAAGVDPEAVDRATTELDAEIDDAVASASKCTRAEGERFTSCRRPNRSSRRRREERAFTKRRGRRPATREKKMAQK